MATQDDYMKTALRLPRELHTKLTAAAEATGKSLNAEMIARLTESFIGTVDQSILMSTVARLNLNLARADLQETTAKTRLHHLSLFVQSAARIIADHLDPSDQEARGAIEGLLQQTQPYISEPDTLEAELVEKVAKMREANHLLRQAGQQLATRMGINSPFAEDTTAAHHDEMARPANATITAVEGRKILGPEVFPAFPGTTPPEPPKRPKRIVRPASKKTTEK